MSVLYQYPVHRPGNTSRLARADLRSPYSLDDVHARIEAETHEYEDAVRALVSRNPRTRARVIELFLGFVFHDSFVLWRVKSGWGIQSPKLDLTLSTVSGGSVITLTSDILNDSLSRAWMVIGIALPAVVGFSAAAFITRFWVPALIATIVATGSSIYVFFIRKWLVRDFLQATGELLAIIDPYGRMDNSDVFSGKFLEQYSDD